MKNDMTLLVMAAGMGSRFGGLKQIEPVGPHGEVILEFSVYDALEAGFDKAVFVIKKAIEHDFRAIIGKRIEKMIDVEYAFQELDDIPAPYTVPENRVKPWGTGQAVLCAKKYINTPFAVINADDFYGKGGYKELKKHFETSTETCMVGYKLQNTVSENGTVARGICEIENGYLTGVTEHLSIPKDNDFPADTIASMNMFGFMPKLFDELESGFVKFLAEQGTELKSEYLLPRIVDKMIKQDGEKVKVLYTDDKWYGVTYKEDKQSVVDAIAALCAKGLYDKFKA
ncbi:MAG: NDP-sugar synthase [Eubacteriales bacterium]